MQVRVRKFGGEGLNTTFNDIVTIQTGPGGTIVWVSTDGSGADLVLTIESDNHVTQEGTTLWVRRKND